LVIDYFSPRILMYI